MSQLRLRTVTRTSGANAAIKDGTVRPGAAVLDFEEVPVLVHAFRRMVRETAYDVCEMALTTYLCAREHGKPFTALPIFLVRGLHHGAILHNTTSGVRSAKDLEGRRVGVHRGYTVTTGVWARGILSDQYDVDLSRVTWVRSGDEHVADYQPPPNVVPLGEGKDLPAMVAAGELPAGVNLDVEHPNVAPLIAHADEAAFAALRERGLYPINHVMVVRDELLEEHPQIAVSLFQAFAEAKDRYVERLRNGDIDQPTATDRMYRRVMDTTGGDPLPYGIEPNRAVLETLIRYATEQQILTSPIAVEDVFAASTRDLTA